MNLHPKLRPIWQRILILSFLGALLIWKVLHLPRWILPRDFRAIVVNWTYPMFAMIFKSRLTRAYIDQTCQFKMPDTCEPKVVVDQEYRLSEKQIREFYENGYMGPFDAFSPEDMADFHDEMLAIENKKSETYNFITPRDRHLEMPRLWQYMKSPAITERLAQILGPDLLAWRSQIFYKGPHSPAIQWHQASTFMVEDYLDPAIFPPDRSEMFQLTVWVAVDDSTPENGCLEFIPGSHDQIRPIRFGGEHGFYNAQFSLDFDEERQAKVQVPCKSGQFIVFAERCIHGSQPNQTDNHRLAFNMRVVPTNVPVYTNKQKYRSVYNGGNYKLNKWGVSLLRGEDRYRLSRAVDPELPGVVVPPQRQRAA
jgi:non-heme Fe2+,alpha-ketoglutarate-dependent halogenase